MIIRMITSTPQDSPSSWVKEGVFFVIRTVGPLVPLGHVGLSTVRIRATDGESEDDGSLLNSASAAGAGGAIPISV